MADNSKTKIDQYIRNLPEGSREICEKLRRIAIENMPGAIEMVAYNALGYSGSPSSFDRIVYIAPQKNWVNLGFFFGTDLPDPEKLLEGDGKRMRHIKIYAAKEAGNPAIADIVKAAWSKAPAHLEKLHAGRKRKI